MDEFKILNTVIQAIDDKKGANTLTLDLRGVSSLTDFIIIAEGLADRHVMALADQIEEVLSKEGIRPYKTAGKQSGDWIVLDYVWFMVHLFQPGLRERYHLESLWPEARILDNIESGR